MEPSPIARIEVLGPLRLFVGDDEIRLGSRRAIAMLGFLAISANRRSTRASLAAKVWPESDPQVARRNLRQLVFLVRSQVDSAPDLLGADEDDLWLGQGVEVDLAELKRLLVSEEPADWEKAIDVYRGHLLSDLDDPLLLVPRFDLHEEWKRVAFRLINHQFKSGQTAKALDVSRRVIEIDPLDERARFAAVRLLAHSHNLAAAKAEFSDLEQKLKLELGVAPSIPLPKLLAKSSRGDVVWDLEDAPDKPTPRRRPRILGLAAIVVAAITVAYVFQNRPVADRDVLRQWGDAKGPVDVGSAQLAEQLGELAWRDAYGSGEELWLSQIAPYSDRLLDVMRWCNAHDRSRGVRIGGALERYFLLMNRQAEWGDQLRIALDGYPQEASVTYVRASLSLAIAVPGLDEKGHLRRIHFCFETARQLNDSFLTIQAIRAEGFVHAHRERHALARDSYERALKMARDAGDERQTALCLFCIGVMGPDPRMKPADDLTYRLRCAIESFDRFKTLSNIWGTRASASILAANLTKLVDLGISESISKDGLERLISAAAKEQESGNPSGQQVDLIAALRVAIALPETDTACELLRQLILEGVGASLGYEKRAALRSACYALNSKFYLEHIGKVAPAPRAQSPRQIIDSVLK